MPHLESPAKFNKFKTPGPQSDVSCSWRGPKSSKHRASTLMCLYLGSSKRSKSSKARVPNVSLPGEFKNFLKVQSRSPKSDGFFPGEIERNKKSKSRVTPVMFLYLGSSKRGMLFCAVGFQFFKACHWPAWSACCFSWSGTFPLGF